MVCVDALELAELMQVQRVALASCLGGSPGKPCFDCATNKVLQSVPFGDATAAEGGRQITRGIFGQGYSHRSLVGFQNSSAIVAWI
jgi:hypothetical protein